MAALAALALVLYDPLPRRVEAQGPPQVNDIFPTMILPMPKRYHERQYLGIAPEGRFRVADIQARVLVIQVFSMYCTYCQKDAPNVNALHDLILENPEARDKVRIIGIGAGNTSFEVKAFRDLYGIDFPLFPDEDQRLHRVLGEVETPYFFVLRSNPDRTQTVIYSSEGSFGSPEEFLEWILDAVKDEGVPK